MLSRMKLLIALGVVCLVGFSGAAQAKKYKIATGGTAGTYYPAGSGAATLWSVKLEKKHGISVEALKSTGSLDNIAMLQRKDAHLAIVEGLVGKMAARGTGAYKGKPFSELRSITMLWPDVQHFVILANKAKAGTVEDIKGLRFSVGPKGSGTEGTTLSMLEALGVKKSDFEAQNKDYYQAAIAMSKGELDGASMAGGPPVTAVDGLFETDVNVRILAITKPQLNQIIRNTDYPGFPFTITRATYRGLKKPVRTIAQPNLLVCRADVPEEVVYLLTKTLFENLKFMQNVHSVGRFIKLKTALLGLPAVLHPGAYKYFKEKRLKIPAAISP